MQTYPELRAALEADVRKSVEILDQTCGPSWPFRVNLNQLQLSSCRYCIAGQLFVHKVDHSEGWWSGYDYFDHQIVNGPWGERFDGDALDAIDRACNGSAGKYGEEAWCKVILELRAERAELDDAEPALD